MLCLLHGVLCSVQPAVDAAAQPGNAHTRPGMCCTLHATRTAVSSLLLTILQAEGAPTVVPPSVCPNRLPQHSSVNLTACRCEAGPAGGGDQDPVPAPGRPQAQRVLPPGGCHCWVYCAVPCTAGVLRLRALQCSAPTAGALAAPPPTWYPAWWVCKHKGTRKCGALRPVGAPGGPTGPP